MATEVPEIVTGDDLVLPVTLKKDGVTFNIDGAAEVIARLVSTDHNSVYTDEVAQSSAASGADWPNSLVVVEMASSETASVTYQGNALLEIQAPAPGKRTWFVPVKIIKGQIA